MESNEKKPKIEHVAREAGLDMNERIDTLRELFPEAFTEGKVDLDKLKEALGDSVDDRPERYNFTWAGKRDAIRILQMPSRATLVPAPEESVDWDTTKNVFIEGDNLEVLKLLLKPYYGRVKMIYIDPPYNTGKDFVYPDNYSDPLDTYLQISGQKDAEGNLLTSNPDTNGRYHSAWLSMMYPRLFLAKQLLCEDGVLFASIDDNEVAHLRLILNQIFGEENFIANIVWQKKFSPQNDEKYLSESHEHVLLYAQSRATWRAGLLPRTAEADKRYKNPDNDPRGDWESSDLTRQEFRPRDDYEIVSPKTGKVFKPPKGNSWGRPKSVVERLIQDNRIWFGPDGNSVPRIKRFLSEVKKGITPQTLWLRKDAGDTQEGKRILKELFGDVSVFETPKPVKLIDRAMMVAGVNSHEEDLIMDFFAGSCTTAQAVLEANHRDGGNRKYIVIQIPEPVERDDYKNISLIGLGRISSVAKKLKSENKGKLKLANSSVSEDLGVRVYKLSESNYRPWNGIEDNDPGRLDTQLEAFIDPLMEGWKLDNVIYEVAVKEGYGLSLSYSKMEGVKDNTAYRVTDPDKGQSFLICLDDRLDPKTPSSLGLKKDDLFICRDVALTDELAANLALQCRLKTV